MLRNSRAYLIARVKQLATGAILSLDDGTPGMVTCDQFGNLWVNLANGNGGVLAPAINSSWTAFSTPAAATVATATRASAGAGKRNICNSISYSIGAVAAQAVLTLVLRDGASGVGTIIWSLTLGPLPAAGQLNNNVPVNIQGSVATAMTLEFTAAPAATNFESVAMTGSNT